MTLATGVGSMPGDDQPAYDEALRVVLGELTPDQWGLAHLPEVPGLGETAGVEVNLQNRGGQDIREFAGHVNEFRQAVNQLPASGGLNSNFRASVVGHSALSPIDLEEKLGLAGGDIFHGALGLDQLWAARPMLGYGDYRTPLKSLYLCGSGAHPGGGVTGLPGHNAAREILRDGLGKRPG